MSTNLDRFLLSLSEDQKNDLLELLKSNLDKEEKTIQQPQQRSSISVDENFIVKKTEVKNNRRKETVRARKNEWSDEGESRDIETPKTDRVARSRKPSKKMEVECSVCGRSFQTDPKYVYGEYHRCSRCVGR
jgi:hypothetical protein